MAAAHGEACNLTAAALPAHRRCGQLLLTATTKICMLFRTTFPRFTETTCLRQASTGARTRKSNTTTAAMTGQSLTQGASRQVGFLPATSLQIYSYRGKVRRMPLLDRDSYSTRAKTASTVWLRWDGMTLNGIWVTHGRLAITCR